MGILFLLFWFDYKSRFGTTAPGSVALLPNGSIAYFDPNSGVFILSDTNGQNVISEIDPASGNDFKFKTETKRIATEYSKTSASDCRSYVNELMGEVGFAFKLVKDDSDYSGDIVFANEGASVFLASGTYAELAGFVGRQITFYIPVDDPLAPLVTFTTYIEFVEEPGLIALGIAIYIRDQFPVGNNVGQATYYIHPETEVKHVVFDYLKMRWRSTYYYPFMHFVNYGQLLFGWGDESEFFKHNQRDSFTFHDTEFIQKIAFVSNEDPLNVKRYQNFTQRSSKPFLVEASSEPNLSYTSGMYTSVPTSEMGVYEGYVRGYYKKNLYDPKFLNSAVPSTSFVGIDPDTGDLITGWNVDGDYTGLLGVNVVVVQVNGNFLGTVTSAVYNSITNTTFIETSYGNPVETGVSGYLYSADKAMAAGEDMRSYYLTHVLSYDPLSNQSGAQIFNVGIKGILS